MDNELPQRKYPRLKNYDYSTNGAYFITICTQNRKQVLSHVGWGLAPTEMTDMEYTPYGVIAEQQLLLLQERYSFLTVDQFVIMPNHVHVIFILKKEAVGASPHPTIMDIVCAYKSLTTRECRKNGFAGQLFQRSFYEHIIRDRKDYEEISRYIYENPMRWRYDKLYTDT